MENIRDAFDLFISEEMVNLIVDSTNGKIKSTLSNVTDEVLQDDTRPYLRKTDKCEMYALIGLMYFRGLLGQNMHDMNPIFSEWSGHPVFGGCHVKVPFYLPVVTSVFR